MILNLRRLILLGLLGLSTPPYQADKQPRVQPGPSEPDWIVILDRFYKLNMTDDLANPVETTPEKSRARFLKAADGPVTFEPILALGLEVPIHGGFYFTKDLSDLETELWSYQAKSTSKDLEAGEPPKPPLRNGSVTSFDPGQDTIGLWIGNDQFHDRVYTEPSRVSRRNARLASQPYKAMIYPFRDPQTGRIVPNTYLIGWEYSTNDDYQDVVCKISNVRLLD